eukprot:1092006-Prorocentrum_minimum.AAC.1
MNSPVVVCLNKGLMSVWSPNVKAHSTEDTFACTAGARTEGALHLASCLMPHCCASKAHSWLESRILFSDVTILVGSMAGPPHSCAASKASRTFIAPPNATTAIDPCQHQQRHHQQWHHQQRHHQQRHRQQRRHQQRRHQQRHRQQRHRQQRRHQQRRHQQRRHQQRYHQQRHHHAVTHAPYTCARAGGHMDWLLTTNVSMTGPSRDVEVCSCGRDSSVESRLSMSDGRCLFISCGMPHAHNHARAFENVLRRQTTRTSLGHHSNITRTSLEHHSNIT